MALMAAGRALPVARKIVTPRARAALMAATEEGSTRLRLSSSVPSCRAMHWQAARMADRAHGREGMDDAPCLQRRARWYGQMRQAGRARAARHVQLLWGSPSNLDACSARGAVPLSVRGSASLSAQPRLTMSRASSCASARVRQRLMKSSPQAAVASACAPAPGAAVEGPPSGSCTAEPAADTYGRTGGRRGSHAAATVFKSHYTSEATTCRRNSGVVKSVKSCRCGQWHQFWRKISRGVRHASMSRTMSVPSSQS